MNFSILYREAFAALIDAMHRKFDKNAQLSNHLKTWETSINIVATFLNIAKVADHSRVYFFYLKVFSSSEIDFNFLELLYHILTEFLFHFQNTHSYIKLFLQHGMASIESNMQRKYEDVHKFMTNLQNSTRFLHSLCCHSKVFFFFLLKDFNLDLHFFSITNFGISFNSKAIKDTAIIAMIPQLRETLSQLMYKVQAAVVGNNCSSGFWAGNLKNKDLHGDEILSQVCTIFECPKRLFTCHLLSHHFTGNFNYAKYIEW